MGRGFTWNIYTDDLGRPWGLQVDDDFAQIPTSGWSPAGVAAAFPFPRAWLPRRVIGIDSQGKRHTRRVGSNVCDLWTGLVGTFPVEATDQTTDTCVVIGRQAERLRPGP